MKNEFNWVIIIFWIIILPSSCSDDDESEICTNFSTQQILLSSEEAIIGVAPGSMNKFAFVIHSRDSTNNIGQTDFVRVIIDSNQNGELDSIDEVFESENMFHQDPCKISHLFKEGENNCINNENVCYFEGSMVGPNSTIDHAHTYWDFRYPIQGNTIDCEIHFAIQIISNGLIHNYPNYEGDDLLKNVFIYK